MAEYITNQKRRKSSLVFPNEPKTDRGEFLKFIDQSGIGEVMQEVLEALQSATDRPDDPIHWIRNYLRERAPRRTAELNSIVESLKSDIIDLETEIHNAKVFTEMQEENKVMRASLWYPQKLCQHYPVDKAYVENGGDEIWQVKPDPFFKPSTRPRLFSAIVYDPDRDDAIMQDLMTPPPGPSAHAFDLDTIASQRGSLSGDLLEILGDERVQSPLCKSTETSPQLSQDSLLGQLLEFEDEPPGKTDSEDFAPLSPVVEQVDTPIPLPQIEDEDFLARRLPPNFWKHNFSVDSWVDKREYEEDFGEDDDDLPTSQTQPLLYGADYKMAEIPENSWLPTREPAYHVRRNQYYSQLDKSDMPNSVPAEWLDRFHGSLGGDRQIHPLQPPLTKKQKAGIKMLNLQQKRQEESANAAGSDSDIPMTDYEWTMKKRGGGAQLRRFSKKALVSESETD